MIRAALESPSPKRAFYRGVWCGGSSFLCGSITPGIGARRRPADIPPRRAGVPAAGSLLSGALRAGPPTPDRGFCQRCRPSSADAVSGRWEPLGGNAVSNRTVASAPRTQLTSVSLTFPLSSLFSPPNAPAQTPVGLARLVQPKPPLDWRVWYSPNPRWTGAFGTAQTPVGLARLVQPKPRSGFPPSGLPNLTMGYINKIPAGYAPAGIAAVTGG
jgi:hypothetical protein